MRTDLQTLLDTRAWILADGATGTNLFNAGLEAGEAPELWNVDRPDAVRALYRGAVEAGSDLFLTNSFGGTSARLKLHDAQDRVYELNRAAATLGREVADAAERPVVVAGSMGPTGEILEPVGALSIADAAAMFAETVDLPTPPLPLATAMIRAMPGIFWGPVGSALRLGLRSGGALGVVWAVSNAETEVTPSTASTASCAAVRTGSIAVARLPSISITKRTVPSSTVSARTMPAATTSCLENGSSIFDRAASTASRVALIRRVPRWCR